MLRPYEQALVQWLLHVPHVPDVPLTATQVVKLLLRYGGNPQQSNRKGETPLKVASSPTMVNLLLGKGTYTSSEESSAGQCWGGERGRQGAGQVVSLQAACLDALLGCLVRASRL